MYTTTIINALVGPSKIAHLGEKCVAVKFRKEQECSQLHTGKIIQLTLGYQHVSLKDRGFQTLYWDIFTDCFERNRPPSLRKEAEKEVSEGRSGGHANFPLDHYVQKELTYLVSVEVK
ncbi:hypothetical protein NECAME_12078 [Necator americanus]|uniref:Uncharacterized protein n=1 Tax=Necator americanus TaxID=51031 RepID=W2T2W5_NECAM|nr:hypothetical protein NECAME_12078 [Necator americanus]ETN75904.1 hypothetical protein NECAME_12078 [Necator americanus]